MKSFLKTTLSLCLISALALVGCNQNSTAKASTAKPETSETTKAPLSNTAAQSSDPNHNSEVANALQANLNKSGVDLHVLSATPSGVPDMYFVNLDGAEPIFTDKTGTYLFQGALIELGGSKPKDISAKLHAGNAVKALSAMDKKGMIIFPAKGSTKAAIYVFTDPTCGYCQKLHQEINDINAGGIEVRYLAWPRGEQMLTLSESVWCSKDRNDALTRAKKGEKLAPVSCDNPVKSHVALGYSLGVSGTPAIFAENGTQLGGYVPSAELIKMAIENKS